MVSRFRPTFSREHGLYIVLLAAFTTGIALAGAISLASGVAVVLVFGAIQTEHALGMVLRRRGDRARHLVWSIVYGSIVLSTAVWLVWKVPALLWVYLGGMVALAFDAVALAWSQRKGVINELVGFTAASGAALLAYGSVVGELSPEALALWVLDSSYFGSSVFVVKLRKPRSKALRLGLAYHVFAGVTLTILVVIGVLDPRAALGFLLAPLKFTLFAIRLNWFRAMKIQHVGLLETLGAGAFVAWISLTI